MIARVDLSPASPETAIFFPHGDPGMKRNKRIVVLCHCLLNVNAKISGLAHYGGILPHVVDMCLASGAGIMQLPCPETTYLGVKRWGMTRNQYDTPFYRRHCRDLLSPIVAQLCEYLDNGYTIDKIIGVDGSPSCGVRHTCEGYCGGMIDSRSTQPFQEVAGKGVFLDELVKMLAEQGISLPLDAIAENDPL